MKYLVVEKITAMNSVIENVCVIEADSEQQAIDKAAQHLQRSRYTLFAFNIDEMENLPWSYYAPL